MTVTFREVSDFHLLPDDQAVKVLYDELIPACERKKVCLSQYGNHNTFGALLSIADYNKKKEDKKLFDLQRIKTAFQAIPEMLQPITTYKLGSYGLKHTVEKRQNEYLTNGDLIATMLMQGYKARFAKSGEPLNVNCEFKAKV